jgi:hypothetical protein
LPDGSTVPAGIGGQAFPALVLNADFRPISYFPLSIWAWQDAVKAVFLDRVSVLNDYEAQVRSPTLSMRLPSVIVLKEYIPAARRPAFTWFNVFLRDRFECQYCSEGRPAHDLTFDHVVPRSRGGRTTWGNVRGGRNIVCVWLQRLRDTMHCVLGPRGIVKRPAPERAAA